MSERDEALRREVQQVAWRWARNQSAADTRMDASSPYEVGLSRDQRRKAWLATLAGLAAVQSESTRLAEEAAAQAVDHGADYPDLGRAAGLTRQGARRRWPDLPVIRSLSRRRRRSITDDLLAPETIHDPLAFPDVWRQ